MSVLLARDIISGQEGTATLNIDGNVETMFYLKNLEAKVDKNKEAVRTIGKRGEQQKANGFSGTGSMTIFYITSRFRQMMLDYIKNGIDYYFTITVTNDDPASSAGVQTTVLYNCNIDSVVMALLDVDTNSLEEDVSFTFDDVDILDSFNRPSNM